MAKTLMEQAIDGQRKAIETLYEANKKKVYYLAYTLLLDEKKAENAAIWAFKTVLDDLTTSSIKTEKEFTDLVIKKIVTYCKRNVLQQNQKAFQTPKNKSFILTLDKISANNPEDFTHKMLETLPELQRFIFILHNVGNYDEKELGISFKFDAKTIDNALEHERNTINNLINISKQAISYEDIIDVLNIEQKNVLIPNRMDRQISGTITDIVIPIENKKKQKRTRGTIIIVVVSLLIIIGLCSTVYFTSSNDDVNDTSSDIADTHEDTSNTTETSLKEDAIYYADIEIKDYGKITVQLDQKSAPITVENFVNLVNDNFYDGLTFHRIIEGFMMQGGDPNGNGTGGSNTNIVGEFSDNGYDNNLSHTRGAISMARSNDYNSASSQFFIVHEDSTYLDGQYAVFGYVTEGLEVVDKVCAEAKPIDNNGTIETAEQPIITSITMREE